MNTVVERSENLTSVSQNLRESLKSISTILSQVGGGGTAEPSLGPAVAAEEEPSSSTAPAVVFRLAPTLAPRELEPIGYYQLSPTCKCDLDEERREPLEFSKTMLREWWKDDSDAFGAR